MPKFAWIGLGVMGAPMARHLATKTGQPIAVYNRTATKTKSWLEDNDGQFCQTPKAAAEGADFIFSCVGRDEDLDDVTLGKDGAFHTLKPGSIFIDHSTVSASISRRLATEAEDRGAFFIDAPISGGQSGAEKGILSIMAGGDKQAFDEVIPYLQTYGKTIALIGDSGAGQMAKMVNQIAIAGLLQGLSEALYFAKQQKLDIPKIMSVITNGAAGSWQMANRWQTMMDDQFDHGFALDWMIKDLEICLKQAEKNEIILPVTKLVDGYYKTLREDGLGRMDTSALIKHVETINKNS